ncbi:glycoside hydrolase family 32 protein [Pseudoalteromonas sp. PAB 2.2]|jgi:levanase/fructan beta-fructosidase|uniref:glycoside hydrolase family 32 protein n=1 Tax=Alteromonadales TaxID=135622 RepID=UPI00094FB0EA|nr:glycoside hydrolase family 32 protein [Pseudoalteromonas sp. PAB 2.2]
MRVVNLIVISSFMAACGMTDKVQKTGVDLVANSAAEAFRPAYHFTPPQNWMNDPNGMVYYKGEYHLFYQHNPNDTVWGPMYWGHAISKDMVNWEHQPIKLFPDEHGTIFSGSAVIDWQNTSGLGSKENPPMVAIFTYHNEEKAKAGDIDFQTQGIAYSLDKGRTWTKYEDNPVLKNPGIRDFRDPKVSWDLQTNSWIMVLAQDDHIGFYSSKDLKNWQQESTFGADWGSHAGVWECPDLIRVRIEGTDKYKYVLLVSINPGAPNGGSGTQYFVGDFDGKKFVLDKQYQSMLKSTPATFPEGLSFSDFEKGIESWNVTGDAFHVEQGEQSIVSSFNGTDESTGSMLSPAFDINKPFINFKIAGGKHHNRTAAQLIIDNKVVRTSTGNNSGNLLEKSWSVSEFEGKSAQIKIVDNEISHWGHIKVSDIIFSEHAANTKIEPSVWLDYGTDNYAGVTFADVKDGRHLFMGWMSNWQYANTVPTESWRGAMTIPRELKLLQTNEGLRVASVPVKELDTLLSGEQKQAILEGRKSYALHELFKIASGQFRAQFGANSKNQELIEIKLSSINQESVSILLNPKTGLVSLDRSKSGLSDFDQEFTRLQKAPVIANLENYQFDIWVDKGSIEVFINDGQTTLTSVVFPTEPYSQLSILSSQELTLNDVSVTNISVTK